MFRVASFCDLALNKTRKALQIIVLKRLPIPVSGLADPDELKPHRQLLMRGFSNIFGQIDLSRIAPQALQIVKIASLSIKEMNNEITVIEQHPFCGAIALDPHRSPSKLLLQLFIDLVGDRLYLPLIGTIGDHEKLREADNS